MTANVICERVFRITVDGEARPVPVRWLKPVPEGADWACYFEIDWPDRAMRRQRAFGVDSTQALVLALQMVASELYTSQPPVFWMRQDDDLGLPVAKVIADLRDARSDD